MNNRILLQLFMNTNYIQMSEEEKSKYVIQILVLSSKVYDLSGQQRPNYLINISIKWAYYFFLAEACSPFHFLYPSTYILMNKYFSLHLTGIHLPLSAPKLFPQEHIWLTHKISRTKVQVQLTATGPNIPQLYPSVGNFSSSTRGGGGSR